MIEIKHLKKEYPNVTPIKDLSMTLNKGDVVSVIGPSGTGKSTLLRMINMLERPTSGQIIVDGDDITAPRYPLHKARAKVAMVFQSFNLFNHMTIIENVCFAPVKLYDVTPAEAYEKGMKLLERVGLAQSALKYPDQLSGGQKQRAAIARTLAVEPEVILFDEPTSALDPMMVGEVESVIQDLSKSGYTMMIVTHDMTFAEKAANRVIYLDEGGIYEDGAPEQVFRNPLREKTRSFVKQYRTREFIIDSKDVDYLSFFSGLEQFAYRQDMDPALRNRVHAVFEELCFQIMLPKYEGRDTDIRVKIEYSVRDHDVNMGVAYSGIELNTEDEKDALSWNIINHSVDSMKMETAADGGKYISIVMS